MEELAEKMAQAIRELTAPAQQEPGSSEMVSKATLVAVLQHAIDVASAHESQCLKVNDYDQAAGHTSYRNAVTDIARCFDINSTVTLSAAKDAQ